MSASSRCHIWLGVAFEPFREGQKKIPPGLRRSLNTKERRQSSSPPVFVKDGLELTVVHDQREILGFGIILAETGYTPARVDFQAENGETEDCGSLKVLSIPDISRKVEELTPRLEAIFKKNRWGLSKVKPRLYLASSLEY